MTECTDAGAKRALEALFTGDLDAEGFARLRAHAAGCASCREAYERLSSVESALERRALPAHRQELLEQALLARVAREAPAAAPRAQAPGWRPLALGGLGVLAASLLLGGTWLLWPREPEWQARGVEGQSRAWGIRAFCIGPSGQVSAEARPGQTLTCAPGSSVQFSYTTPASARLSLVATSPSGEPLQLFPPEGSAAPVQPGVDVPLPYSSPVTAEWLPAPLQVRAIFTDESGQRLSGSELTLRPR